MKALILFLEYDKLKATQALDIIIEIVERCNEVAFTIVRIDNKHPEIPWQQTKEGRFREYIVGGDNKCNEFSGWDKGWNDSKYQIKDTFDIVIIANDALLNSKPVRELESITNHLLKHVFRTKTVVGWIDTFSRVSPDPIDMIFSTMKVFGNSVRRWICTTFIVFSSSVFQAVFPLTSFENFDRVYHKKFSNGVFLPDCGLNTKYQKFLFAHQSIKWIKSYKLTSETFDLFKLKTRNIINETLLGYRIAKTNSKLLHITILYYYQVKKSTSLTTRIIKRLYRFSFIQYYLLYLFSLILSAKEIYNSAKKYYFIKINNIING